ncbi:hypothetical protein [Demequina sp. NBRC 110057]|uniref:variant leucine-rich repeat-containing protein n=1 Tax=Demequina sp. NBRC 110057 TaxID=1570346 RepID=UPI000A07B9C3|nr:hypothetical protein [Demequina sp. NBRC 110057]
MSWSGEEYVLLTTGVLFAGAVAASAHPRVTLTTRSRVTFSVGAAAFMLGAIFLASIETVVYPSLVWLTPLVPLAILAVMLRDAWVAPPAAPASAVVRRTSLIPVHQATPGSASDRLLRSRAADPTATPAELARIAYAHPDMRATIAANPASPASLLEWLASVGDPAVHSAISTRTRATI